MTVLTRIKQPLRLVRQVIQQIGAEYESTGTIDDSNLSELHEIEAESLRTYERIKQVREQVELNRQYRMDSAGALPIAEDRLRQIETIMEGLPILLATDDENLDEFVVWIAKAPEYFKAALVRTESSIFEAVRKALDAANVERKT